jgi:hypothetical protein
MRTTLLPTTSVVTMVNAPEEDVVVRNNNHHLPPSGSYVPTNPGLSIMTGRQRRVKGYTRRRMRERRASMQTRFKLKDNIRGLALVLIAVLLFLVIEVLVVDKFVLRASGKLSNIEERIKGGNVYVSDIVESSLNRYRLKPGIEFEKVIETAEQKAKIAEEKLKAKAHLLGNKIEGKIEAAEETIKHLRGGG